MKIKTCFAIILIFAFIFPLQSNAKIKKYTAAQFSLHIFTSSNITGNIEPCG